MLDYISMDIIGGVHDIPYGLKILSVMSNFFFSFFFFHKELRKIELYTMLILFKSISASFYPTSVYRI